mmetsp:Transcript_3652/g.4044  ORF Transcript_3652/g.4044 Transcript_3652/m.4044 type:complete len:216 (-) Transcript_3652:388-1035(-)
MTCRERLCVLRRALPPSSFFFFLLKNLPKMPPPPFACLPFSSADLWFFLPVESSGLFLDTMTLLESDLRICAVFTGALAGLGLRCLSSTGVVGIDAIGSTSSTVDVRDLDGVPSELEKSPAFVNLDRFVLAVLVASFFFLLSSLLLLSVDSDASDALSPDTSSLFSSLLVLGELSVRSFVAEVSIDTDAVRFLFAFFECLPLLVVAFKSVVPFVR